MKIIHRLQRLTDDGRPATTAEEVLVFTSMNAEFCALLRGDVLRVFGENQKSTELPHKKLVEDYNIYKGTFDGVPIQVSLKNNITGILVLDLTPNQSITANV